MARPRADRGTSWKLRPICSSTHRDVNFGAFALSNIPDHVERMARAIREAGVNRSSRYSDLATPARTDLHRARLIADPPWFQSALGPGGVRRRRRNDVAMKQLVLRSKLERLWHRQPGNFRWSRSVILGGHVRAASRITLSQARGALAG